MLLVHDIVHRVPHIADDVGITRQIALRENVGAHATLSNVALVDLHIERVIGVRPEDNVGERHGAVVDVKGLSLNVFRHAYRLAAKADIP